MTKDMTSGSTLRHIINFAVPLCMGMLFQQLYSMVDTMIVGKVLGVQPLAGVGATGSLNFMIIWYFMQEMVYLSTPERCIPRKPPRPPVIFIKKISFFTDV